MTGPAAGRMPALAAIAAARAAALRARLATPEPGALPADVHVASEGEDVVLSARGLHRRWGFDARLRDYGRQG